ncbi:hypothetical protein APHWI1_1108 [Anaplasma phagocytophilum str. ApWI1]|nr:hypothetical protein YYU_00545 [Anaplasma phagocytophilum str. HZ2]AGR80443.1 hypothetical protein WSQ_00545 [Anaplasma phagocytophilum str. JM]AGR81697.1 hypothetical protein YYY_00545 [Anaplasma phagocytophilum str. Dog2]KJV60464.1 hypothetical protein APHWEB_0405 [Anaplasma phagocytophilum str. Webster]KJV68581.1 hypothetical protein EPHNCH_0320 [Anaplasma phagocytophilum str. NCH-1]KJV82295.1 hypothetical protein APHHGE2_0334 [Anaplasma phagocytophilum str. HGE2]KJV84684.1 hypothetical
MTFVLVPTALRREAIHISVVDSLVMHLKVPLAKLLGYVTTESAFCII